jgi:(p)ppGpp synthase/HD superfamily hydrolase
MEKIQNAKQYLQPSGKILLEHGYNQHQAVQTLLKENGFDVSISGRIKNLFSVFKKLKKKTATLHEIYD